MFFFDKFLIEYNKLSEDRPVYTEKVFLWFLDEYIKERIKVFSGISVIIFNTKVPKNHMFNLVKPIGETERQKLIFSILRKLYGKNASGVLAKRFITHAENLARNSFVQYENIDRNDYVECKIFLTKMLKASL